MKPKPTTDWNYSNVTVSHYVEKKLDDIFKDYVKTYLLHYRTCCSSVENIIRDSLQEDQITKAEHAAFFDWDGPVSNRQSGEIRHLEF